MSDIKDDMDQSDFGSFLQSLIEDIPESDCPHTLGFTKLLQKEAEGLHRAGQELTSKRLVALLIPLLGRFEKGISLSREQESEA